MKKCAIWGKYRRFEKPKISYLLEKTLVFLLFEVSVKMKKKKMFKEEESVEILKIPGLIKNIQLLWRYGWRKHKSRMYIQKCEWNKKILLEEIWQNELMRRKYKKDFQL